MPSSNHKVQLKGIETEKSQSRLSLLVQLWCVFIESIPVIDSIDMFSTIYGVAASLFINWLQVRVLSGSYAKPVVDVERLLASLHFEHRSKLDQMGIEIDSFKSTKTFE